MRKLLLFAILSLFLSGCTIPFFSGKKSGIKITSSPQATVILDGKQVGQTPLDKSDLKPKSYKLQLIPQSGQPWETSVTLRQNVQAVIERVFGETDQESEGYIMELEQISDKSQSQLSVVTIPDLATVRIDGQPKGFAPVVTLLTTDGVHEATVSSAGYNEKKISLTVPKGYKLFLTVQLSRSKLLESTPDSTSSGEPDQTITPTQAVSSGKVTPPVKAKGTPTPTPTLTSKQKTLTPTPSIAPTKPYVEILDTPTGWLRVRSEPNTTTGKEITKVYPKETYKFLESNDTGWYQIQLPDGQKGWISGQYAKLYR